MFPTSPIRALYCSNSVESAIVVSLGFSFAALPAQRLVQHPREAYAGPFDLDFDQRGRSCVVGLVDRDHLRDLARARGRHRKQRVDDLSRDPVALGGPI